jgi:hypothetical protein
MGHRKGNTPQSGMHEFDRLLNPANAFAHPLDVVDDTDLTLAEKRAFLSGWAACTDDESPVRYDDVMIALKELARRSGDLRTPSRYRRILERRVPGVFGRKDDPRPSRPAA